MWGQCTFKTTRGQDDNVSVAIQSVGGGVWWIGRWDGSFTEDRERTVVAAEDDIVDRTAYLLRAD